ncbi:oligosaccharide flippase family protein [Candidatus Parcubacteria bacterium]|nr:oligosaccharide flippase family protein [Candidatus Parcubacteria bacterium]
MIKKIKNKIYNFLKWTEKWTKTDMIYIAKGSLWLTFGQTISIILAFAVSIAFANLLPKNTYGSYKFLLSIIGIISIFSLKGMTTALVNTSARNYDGTLKKIIKIKISWGMIGSLVSFGISAYYYLNNNTDLAISFLIIALFLPFSESLSSYAPFFQGKKLFKTYTKYNVITQVFITLSMILTLFLTNSIIFVMLAYLASRVIIYLILLIKTTTKYCLNNKIDVKMINFGKHLSFMGVLGIVASQIDKILIWKYLGASQLAIYSMATLPIDQIKSILFKNTALLALPKFSENNVNNLKKTLPKKIKKFFLITLIISLIYILFAPNMFNLLFPKYTDSILYSQILALTIIIIPLNLFQTAIASQGQKKKLYVLSISSSIIQIILYFILLPLYGLKGIIISIFGFQLYQKIMLVYLFKKM